MAASSKGRGEDRTGRDDRNATAPTLDGAAMDSSDGGDLPRIEVRASRVGRFTLIRQIGEGGMGAVFAAYDEQLDRKVALKILRKHDKRDTRGQQKLLTLREARAAARISHPNVISVYEVGEANGQIHIAMEYVDGGTLLFWQRQEARSWREILAMYQQAGEALLAAHVAGVVHRDFKPDNVLVGSDGRPRVVDFGLARVGWMDALPDLTVSPIPAEVHRDARQSGRLTLPGVISGTPGYMSPEQYRGGDVDSRSDQWSFCATLFEALYGYLPFSGSSVNEHAESVHGPPRPPPASTNVPEEIHRALVRGLSATPNERFPSMVELLSILSQEQRDDASAGGLSRRRFTNAFVFAGLAVMALLQYRQASRLIRPREALVASLGLLLVVLLGGLWRRHTLLNRRFHRQMWTVLVLVIVENMLQRVVGSFVGMSMQQLFPFEMIVIAGGSALIAALLVRWLWFLPLVLLAAAAFSISGLVSHRILLFTYSAVVILVGVAWSRAANAATAKGKEAESGTARSGFKSQRVYRTPSHPSDRTSSNP